MTFSVDPQAVVAFLLVMTRLVTVFTVAPPFAGGLLPNRVRIALGASIALVVPPVQGAPVPLEPAPLMAAITYQVVVGALFGYLIQLLLSAPVIAGTYLDTVAGLSAGGLFDPTLNTSTSPGGRLHQMITMIILISTDGHLLMIRGVVRTYEAAPLSGLRIEPLETMLRDGLALAVLAAIEIALPLLVALLLTETMLGLASRAAPRLNVMVVGFAVKSLVFILGFTLTVPLLINAVGGLADRSLRWAVTVGGG